ncbi:hypothetical protein C2G38_2068980 [Gigaspora rosea]|uniref:Uncharacterized protein n=1 Tax=Gigaspora rosea TaxID=44941 RepID=A0A397VU02_9GLOM|nr:hypothetical protein C2G38_2068980 [Gigaspora rosea]
MSISFFEPRYQSFFPFENANYSITLLRFKISWNPFLLFRFIEQSRVHYFHFSFFLKTLSNDFFFIVLKIIISILL